MSRMSHTYGLSIFETAALNYASSVVIRTDLNCDSSTVSHNETLSDQNGDMRSRAFTASTLPPVMPLLAISNIILKFGWYSRLPLPFDHVGVTNL